MIEDSSAEQPQFKNITRYLKSVTPSISDISTNKNLNLTINKKRAPGCQICNLQNNEAD